MPIPNHLALGLAALCATLAGCSTPPAAPPASEATVMAHLAAAQQAAGTEYPEYLNLCKPAPLKRPDAGSVDLAGLIARPAPPPGAAFDNLIYVGSAWVSAWALKTSDGLVLIDALNTVDEVERLIVPGLASQGLAPADIRTVLVTHGHGDHYGGAERLRALAGATPPRLVMSALDWTMTETQLEFASPIWPAPPRRNPARDLAARDGDLLRQGDTTVQLHVTPGHTLGTISPVFEVRAGGRTHKALVWGGTSFNFGRDLSRLDAYIAAADRMREIARREQIDVLLSNHPANDLTVKRLAALRANPAMANPFVIGNAGVLRTLTVISECAKANRDRFALMP
ncbi:MBL fold metallo-hydrolase [Aquabacterium sp. OR-4]|uniref:MBL fold metallo-hydrolase n=1 Tax=Aquabacterium sp. OR-4 TaxID=2978127 RepID=UPI0028C6A50E|nr:MBL fold metallo-hydrolase [Aquabacterium sp. OR-4]MDT7838860.1 MBL fold metallo-hydrolase [Aquabacterium sp. OR-4]